MAGHITSRFWPPLPQMRHCLKAVWIVGDHGFWVKRLNSTSEWIAPWYGSKRDYDAIRRCEDERLAAQLRSIPRASN